MARKNRNVRDRHMSRAAQVALTRRLSPVGGNRGYKQRRTESNPTMAFHQTEAAKRRQYRDSR